MSNKVVVHPHNTCKAIHIKNHAFKKRVETPSKYENKKAKGKKEEVTMEKRFRNINQELNDSLSTFIHKHPNDAKHGTSLFPSDFPVAGNLSSDTSTHEIQTSDTLQVILYISIIIFM